LNYVTGNPNFKEKPIFDIEFQKWYSRYIVKMEANMNLHTPYSTV